MLFLIGCILIGWGIRDCALAVYPEWILLMIAGVGCVMMEIILKDVNEKDAD